MADNEEVAAATTEGGASRGADWEVVTLTASAYAAAPGGGPAPEDDMGGRDGRGSSNALLMSDHFVFPPSEHENLPIQTALEEYEALAAGEEDVQEESTSVGDTGFNSVVGGTGSERVQYYDEGRSMTADEAEMFGDVAAEHGSFRAKDDGDDDVDDSQDKSDVPPHDSKSRGSGDPYQRWLKKHMSCLYDQAKENNALWSVVVAAAFVGFVILWRKDKLHISCFKWRSSSAVR